MAEKARYVTCVCTANICRSPIAERLLQHALMAEEEPLKSLHVVSAGVGAWDGDQPSANSVKALKKVGIDLSDHRSRRISCEMIDESVLVLCMTESHRSVILANCPDTETPIHLFREFMGPDADIEIPDPYGMDLTVYEACRDAMVEAVPSVVEHLRDLLKG